MNKNITLKDVIIYIDKCVENQKFCSRWINLDGSVIEGCDVGYVCDWWEEFREVLKKNKDWEWRDKNILELTNENLTLKHDRDTWKKACELACGSKGIMHCPYCLEKNDYFVFNEEEYGCKGCNAIAIDDEKKQAKCWANFFYQQAQKEMKDD